MIVIASTFTAEPVERPLRFWLDKLGLPDEVRFAPFNQVMQQFVDRSSLWHAPTASVRVLLVRSDDFGSSASNLDGFARLLKSNADAETRPVVICVCPPNEATLVAMLTRLPSVHLVRTSEIAALYPVAEVFDAVANELAAVPYTEEFFTALGTAIARKLFSLLHNPLKAVIVDCDGTLWKGVIGEDGSEGLTLDDGSLALQRRLVALHRAGVLLCLCTKNSEGDVRSVFDNRADMVLQLSHVAGIRANWLPKSENVRSLMDELGFAPDAIAYVDDNPVECAEVRAAIPGIIVLHVPSDVRAFADHCWLLERIGVTDEDARRGEFYKSEQGRQDRLLSAPTFADFLESLHLQVSIESLTEAHLLRASQMTMRTTQFNINPMPRRVPDLLELMSSREFYLIEASDRFGDYGMVGLVGFSIKDAILCVHDLLLSCRALSRGIEEKIVNFLGSTAIERGASEVRFTLRETERNAPATGLIRQLGEHADPRALAKFRFVQPLTTGKKTQSPHSPGAQMHGRTDFGEIARELRDVPSILAAIREQGGGSRVHAFSSDTEAQLAGIWAEVLGRQSVSPEEDFFDLGGDSLKATQIVSRIQRRFGVPLGIESVFAEATVQRVAMIVHAMKAQPDTAGNYII